MKKDFIRLIGDETSERVARPQIQKYGEKAKELLERNCIDHVVYGEKFYSSSFDVTEINLFLLPLSDEKFKELYGNINLFRYVYSIHA